MCVHVWMYVGRHAWVWIWIPQWNCITIMEFCYFYSHHISEISYIRILSFQNVWKNGIHEFKIPVILKSGVLFFFQEFQNSVDSDVNGFFDGSGHIITLPSYNLKVFHWCCVASNIIMFKYQWWCLQVFSISFLKGSGWLPNVIIITLSSATFKPVYNVTLFCDISLSFGNINRHRQ